MDFSTRWRNNLPNIPRTLHDPTARDRTCLESPRLPIGTLSTRRNHHTHIWKPHWDKNRVGQGQLRSSKMAVENIQRKRRGLSMHSNLLQTGSYNGRKRPGFIIFSISDTLLKHKKERMSKNGMYIRPGRRYKILKKEGDLIILIGDINEYMFSRKTGSFTSKLRLW